MAKQMGIYRPRSPKKSPFYQCITDHFEEFIQAYDERYEREYGFWRPVIAEVIEKFLECGDLNYGFARVRCDHFGHEYLLAFSCKGRYFCPSCHMKRVLQFSEWLTAEVLEDVIHQQYVFTIPKIIRPYFKYHRALLGKLCLCAYKRILRCMPPGRYCPRGSDLYSDLGEYGRQLSSTLACIGFKGGFRCPWHFLSSALDRYTKDGASVQREGLYYAYLRGKDCEDLAGRICEWPLCCELS